MQLRLFRSLILATALAAGTAVLGQNHATANTTLFMSLKGAKAGVIQGEVVQKGREGMHSVLAYSHEVVSPRDPATGLPTGKRQHQPFRIVKLINRGSPLILNALATNENLPTVTIELWVPSATGSETKLLTYTLTNAQLASVRPWMPNKSDAATTTYPPAEELAFTYQKITVTYTGDGGDTMAEDDWGTTGL